MRLTDLLTPDRVILGIRAADKAHALTELARLAAAALPIGADVIYTALANREALGSTGLGRGFALPHVRMHGLGTSFGLLVRLAKPIAYEAIDRKPVDILFTLLSPADGGNAHVAALATVSRSMRAEVLSEIRQAGDPAALLNALAEAERLRG